MPAEAILRCFGISKKSNICGTVCVKSECHHLHKFGTNVTRFALRRLKTRHRLNKSRRAYCKRNWIIKKQPDKPTSPGNWRSPVVRHNTECSRIVGRVWRSSSGWQLGKEMDKCESMMTHIRVLIRPRSASCWVATSHTEVHRYVISPNETGLPPMTTRNRP